MKLSFCLGYSTSLIFITEIIDWLEDIPEFRWKLEMGMFELSDEGFALYMFDLFEIVNDYREAFSCRLLLKRSC
jgi:hypothetical protein